MSQGPSQLGCLAALMRCTERPYGAVCQTVGQWKQVSNLKLSLTEPRLAHLTALNVLLFF